MFYGLWQCMNLFRITINTHCYQSYIVVIFCKKGLFTSNSLQCALKRIRIECASNPDSIHFGTFHTTKMQCALSNRIITQSALCIYIESNSVSQHGDAPSYFKIMLFFALASLGCIANTNWRENKENIWRRKELKKEGNCFLRSKQQFRRHRFDEIS